MRLHFVDIFITSGVVMPIKFDIQGSSLVELDQSSAGWETLIKAKVGAPALS